MCVVCVAQEYPISSGDSIGLPALCLHECSVATREREFTAMLPGNRTVKFVAVSFLISVAVRVPPNSWYGFRVRATLEHEEVWYPANEYAGKRLFWVGLSTVVSALDLFLLPISNVDIYASAVCGIVMVGLVVTLVQSFLYLRTLTERH